MVTKIVISKLDLDVPKMGYIIVYKKDKSIIGKAIEAEQLREGFSPEHAQYVHVEGSGGGQWSSGAFFPKSGIVDITKKHKGREIVIVRVKKPDYTYKRYKVAWFSATLCNLKYGWFSLLWFKINDAMFSTSNKFAKYIERFGIKIPKNPFCSRKEMWAVQMVYPELSEWVKPENTMPAHFLNPDHFEEVWTGTIL